MRPPTDGRDRRFILCAGTALFPLLAVAGCGSSSSESTLTADAMPLHLEDHLGAAVIEGSEVPADGPEFIGWIFDEPQPDWRAFSVAESRNPMQETRTDDALRVIVTDADSSAVVGDWSVAGIYTDYPGLLHLEATHLMIRARTESAGLMAVARSERSPPTILRISNSRPTRGVRAVAPRGAFRNGSSSWIHCGNHSGTTLGFKSAKGRPFRVTSFVTSLDAGTSGIS